MQTLLRAFFLASGFALAGSVGAEEIDVAIHRISAEGVGEVIGEVKAVDNEYGLLLMPNLIGLSPGIHGFHVHQNPDCGPAEKEGEMVAGLAAGGHYDPQDTGAHKGPYDPAGHLGDLPALYFEIQEATPAGMVAEEKGKIEAPLGAATLPVLAPRLKTADLKGRSLMIHQGGDNYSDYPQPLGGGGSRVACGVVE